MAWDFETDPEFQAKLDWADKFVREEVAPIDYIIDHPWNVADPLRNQLVRPLQAAVRENGLWACHLGPDLGGPGYGQLPLALLNEILGRTHSGPIVFGCQAPDSGNAEILAHYGNDEQKSRWLTPLINGDIVSSFSMTEPEGGSDPTSFGCRAHRDGDEWVITGEKWFSSNASFASFLIVLAVTDPQAEPHRRLSAFLVPTDADNFEVVRDVRTWANPDRTPSHSYVRYNGVRVGSDALLGQLGDGFAVAQTRLGGGRVHHAMRTVGLVRSIFEMMLERAQSRTTKGSPLAHKQLVQAMIADTFVQLEQFRLLVLHAAWRIDKVRDYRQVRPEIAAVKIAMPKLLSDVTARAIQIHGSLGVTREMPLGGWMLESFHMGLADGATEIHKLNLARELLKGVSPVDDLFPSAHIPRMEAAARTKYADVLGDIER